MTEKVEVLGKKMPSHVYPVKITVFKRISGEYIFGGKENFPKVAEEYPYPDMEKDKEAWPYKCPRFKEGQEFIVKDPSRRPPEFICDWAWSDLIKEIIMLWAGAPVPWSKDEKRNVTYHTCSDGYRPICFKLERLE